MIVIWVLELFLNQLGELRDQKKEKSPEYINLQKDFDEFLSEKLVMVCICPLLNLNHLFGHFFI